MDAEPLMAPCFPTSYFPGGTGAGRAPPRPLPGRRGPRQTGSTVSHTKGAHVRVQSTRLDGRQYRAVQSYLLRVPSPYGNILQCGDGVAHRGVAGLHHDLLHEGLDEGPALGQLAFVQIPAQVPGSRRRWSPRRRAPPAAGTASPWPPPPWPQDAPSVHGGPGWIRGLKSSMSRSVVSARL